MCADTPSPTPEAKDGLHPRNRHRFGYDFARLAAASPALAAFVREGPAGAPTIDFADPAAVLALNRALLLADYGLALWDIPPGFLCPPIPGRADYVHRVADLLAEGAGGAAPRGAAVRALDVGVGAGCVYPVIGCIEYGWSFVATDVSERALGSARRIVAANAALSGRIECRLQRDPLKVFDGVVEDGERFAVCLCNPPFHASAEAAREGTRRKLRNLSGRTQRRDAQPRLNFGGRDNELVCEGGEAGFVGRLIAESARRPGLCGWFTSLVSRSENLPRLEAALRRAGVAEHRVLEMAQGQKRSRALAWRF